MRSFTFLVGVLSLISRILYTRAAPSAATAVFEKLAGTPHGWEQGAAVPASKRLRFRVALKQENAYDFEQHVIDISTPGHPKYGQHMSHQDLKRALRPNSAATESIVGWLEAEGVPASDIEDEGDWINFYVQVTEAERIMNTKLELMHVWEQSLVADHMTGSTTTKTKSMVLLESELCSTRCPRRSSNTSR